MAERTMNAEAQPSTATTGGDRLMAELTMNAEAQPSTATTGETV